MQIVKGTLIALLAIFFIRATPPEEKMEAEQGIQFFQGTWEEALATAEKENKVIFLDAYAAWCGPCKLLKRNVFPNEEVGTFYNENFINVKMDMEKGMGPSVARQYQVTAYPTLLFVNGNGKVVKKAVGYHPPKQLIDLGQSVVGQKI